MDVCGVCVCGKEGGSVGGWVEGSPIEGLACALSPRRAGHSFPSSSITDILTFIIPARVLGQAVVEHEHGGRRGGRAARRDAWRPRRPQQGAAPGVGYGGPCDGGHGV